MCVKIIFGIGNTNKKLLNTRHNIGILFIKKFLNTFNIKKIKYNYIYKLKIKNKYIYIYVPKTYINTCGKNIKKIIKKLKLKNKETLIVHDEINLKPGKIKIKKNIGKKSTHNGIKNILKYLKKDNFYQLRIGIGKPKNKNDLKTFVLSKLKNKEKKKIIYIIKKSIKYIKILTQKNKLSKIQNYINI